MSPKAFIGSLLFLALCLTGLAQEPDPSLIVGRYKQMLAKNPAEGIALDRLWKIYQDKSETDRLLADYKQAADKNDFPSAMVLGLLLRKAGQTGEAVKAFQHAAALSPQSPLPHLALADIFATQSNLKDSANEYETATGLMDEKSPGFPDVLLKLGTARLAAGDPKNASEAWERIITLNPQDLGMHQKLAENYVANNLPDAAIPHFEFVEQNGDVQQRVLALQSLARIYQMKGDADSAIQSLEKAIDLTAPGNWLRAELQEQIIRQYQRAHRTEELETKWKKALADNPRDTGAYLQLIAFYERLGDLDNECATLKGLGDLLPDNLDYKARLAKLYGQLSQPDKAAELLDQILTAQPGNVDVLFARAEIDMQHDAPQLARGRIEAFLQQHQDDESLRARAVDFYSRHRLFDAVEQHLKASSDENSVLELANFYFTQHRDADARRTLLLLAKNDDPREKQAAARLKIANVLKEQKDNQGALEQLKLAVASQPESAEYHLALGDLLESLNHPDAAEVELEKAWQFSRDNQARLDADTKLFQVFQIQPSPPVSNQKEEPPVSLEELLHLGGPAALGPGAGTAAISSKPLQDYVAAMMQDAQQHPTAEAMLRVARWQMWIRNDKVAMAYAKKAVQLQPDSIATREELVRIASTTLRSEAIADLWELIRLNPGKEVDYTRQISRLMLETGRADDAIQLLTALEKSKPGDLDVLIDLANALHGVNREDEALAAWQQAFDLAPAPRRKEIMPSLVHALEQQGRNQNAAEILSNAVAAQPDDAARASLFQDLLVFCAKHDLTAWLQSRYEQKLRGNADDYFLEVALSRILKANGHDADSLSLLSDATFSAPDQAAALGELVAGMEEKGDFETAVACQKRILPLVAQDDPAGLEKLAALQEDNLDLDGAAATWDKITGRFPRDPDALSRAADYFQRWNFSEKARALLRRVTALEPENLQTWMMLARLESDAGDRKEALAAFERILQNSTPKSEEGHLIFPGTKPADDTGLQQTYFSALRLRNGQPNSETMRALRNFWSTGAMKPSGDLELRLNAILAISTLLKSGGDKAAMQAWLARWQPSSSVSAGESLWAFYYSGAHDLVLKQLGDLMQRYPDNLAIKQGFIWVALQMGEYEALNRWLADKGRTVDERDFFMVSLGQVIANANGRLDPGMVDGLFPATCKSVQNMWQVAVQLAAHGYFAPAIKLGGRVFQSSVTLRPVYGLELAHWHIYAGDIDGARAVLKASIAGAGDQPDAAIYEDLREYYSLLPARERDSFVDSYSHSAEQNPLHSALSLSLLYGLQGNYDKARGQVSRLLDLRPMAYRTDEDSQPAFRTWTFILTAGVQFQLWRLNPLAVDIWEKSLADEASLSLLGNQAAEVAREIRMRLVAEKIVDANPADAEEFLDGYLQSASPEIAGAMATILENNGCYAQSAKIYQRLLRAQPDNQHFLLSLLNDCRLGNDTGTEKSTLRQAWSRVPQTPDSPPAVEDMQIALQLIHRLMDDAQYHAAEKVIEQALRLFPLNRELLAQAAGLQATLHHYDLAEKTYRQLLALQPGDPGTRDKLANVLESAGKIEAAIEVLGHPGVPGADENARIASLYLKNGDFEKAEHAARQVLQNHDYDKIPDIASGFFAKGRDKEAREMLLAALSRSKDAPVLFALQATLMENLPGTTPPDLVDKLLGRLEGYLPGDSQPAATPDLQPAYYALKESLAGKFHREGKLEDELAGEWADGGGRIGAGLKLIRIQAQGGQPGKLRATCESLFARPDFSEQAWSGVQAVLEQAGQYDLLAKGWELLALKNPLRDEPSLQVVRALFSSGNKAEAAKALEKLGCRQFFNDATVSEVAQEYCREGDYEAARQWFDIAIRQNPAARSPDVYLQYASMLLDRKDYPAARRVLVGMFRNPAPRDTQVLARYFIDSGRADQVGSGLGEFDLTPAAVTDFYSQLGLYYQQHGEPLKAIAVAEEHPEIILSGRDVARWLRAAAAAGAFEKTASMIEKAIAQSPDDVESGVSDELALLYRDWPGAAPSLDHLKRAADLKPGDFDIASSLSRLYLEKQQPRQAADVLTRFIDVTQDQTLKEQARTLLAKIPAG